MGRGVKNGGNKQGHALGVTTGEGSEGKAMRAGRVPSEKLERGR